MSFNPMEDHMEKCDKCGSVFHEGDTVVLGQHSDFENITVCLTCCAKIVEEQHINITVLEVQNAKLKTENKKMKTCKNCNGEYCSDLGLANEMYKNICVNNNYCGWKKGE